MRLRTPIAAISFLLCMLPTAPAARACIWDDDSLRTEAQGLPGLTEIITGRFDRFPPLYFEMRLARSRAELEADPHNWNAYDNAGVSCDRLGLHDDAVALLCLKLERLREAGIDADATDPEARNHYYRACANLGTLLAHRWIKVGRAAQDLSDLREGRDWIARAIEVNPDAHFGREKYQLLAMEWLIAGYETDAEPEASESTSRPAPHIFEKEFKHSFGFAQNTLAKNFPDAADGLAGLIALGNAWESVDIFYALAVALDDRGDASLAYLASLRCKELLNSGAMSLHPRGVRDSYTFQLEAVEPGFASTMPKEIELFYRDARDEADAWRNARNAYVLARLAEGKHPDRRPDFWDGFVATTSPPELPGGLAWEISSFPRTTTQSLYVFGVSIIVGPIVLFLIIRWIARRAIQSARRSVEAASDDGARAI